jgi:hypothetical protein
MEEVTRMNTRLFKMLSLIAIVALLVCGQAIAADTAHHYTVKLVPRAGGASVEFAPAEPANLFALTAAFTASPLASPDTSPTNSDGTPIWPCFGSYSSASGTSTENPDCPTIGDPKQGFPAGGAVLGSPAYAWSLSACNATASSSPVCGQTETFYEDNTGDETDDLLYTVEATQGTTVIADSGTEDFGPCAFFGGPAGCTGAPGFPFQVVFTGDQNFGTQGVTGKNNGNCLADVNYPLTSNNPVDITYPYLIEANKTCGAAVSGAVTITATTELATPAYTPSTSKTTCAPVGGPPCYTVKYTSKYKISQKILIYLQ